MIKSENAKMVSRFTRAFGKVLEHLTTFMYHEQFKRMTLEPMRGIIQHDQEPELQQRMLRQWAHIKIREASYIQLAGGFLFTTVASCLQWESAQNGHWSARACFYACMLLAFVAIVMGSQQMLLLPSERPPQETSDDSERTEATESKNRYERELKLKEERYLQAIVKRLCDTRRDDGAPNFILVSVMQAPEMLLTGSVITFLGGLCSVIFAPLANQTVWDDNAKIALGFGISGAFCIVVFATASFLVHALFSFQIDQKSKMGWLVPDL